MASLTPVDEPALGGSGSVPRRIQQWLEGKFDCERDQLPLWLPVALGAGIAAWFALPNPVGWTTFIALMLALCLAAIAFGFGARWGKALAVFGLVAAAGCALIWLRATWVSTSTLAYPRMADFVGQVEMVQPLSAQQITRLVIRPRLDARLPQKVRVNVPDDKWIASIAPGATVRVRAWLMPPAPMAVPGAYDFARVAWFQQLGASGRAAEVELLAAAPDQGWSGTIASWRQLLSAHIRSRLEGPAGGIAAAFATGDQGGISEEDAEAMRASGLAHLLSVSGLHLTAVVGLVMFIALRILAFSPTLALRLPLTVIAAGLGALAGIAYTLLTGAEVPTVRACIAAILILIGLAMGREALTLRLVATGALIVLLLWPKSLAGPSFQLSFAAMTAIVALHEHPRIRSLLSRRDEGLVQRGGRILLGLLLTGIAVEIALMPIALYHFHQSGLFGALANIVAIPLTTFVIMPLEAAALFLDIFGAGGFFWWLSGIGLELLLALAHKTASLPWAVATLPTMPVGAFGLMIAGGIWMLLWRTSWRWWGAVPTLAGTMWAMSAPPPDIIVTGDGRHVAVRTSQGSYAILRERAGDYIQDLLAETAGTDAELALIQDLPEARCNRDLCRADLVRDGYRWRLLATRSPLLVPIDQLTRACSTADIVVSDRRLPTTCRPRWLRADRVSLQATGGLAIRLGSAPTIDSVADRVGQHPWTPGTAVKRGEMQTTR